MSVELTTHYLKLPLRNPLVASASPLTGKLESLLALERAGASAVVMQSLFEEQIEHEELEIHRLHDYLGSSCAESLSYFPELENYNTGPEPYLEHIELAKSKLSIPVIGSLNGTAPGKWVRYANLIEQAGADALELNIYFVPTDAEQSASAVEARYLEIVKQVRREISIPLAVKIGPFFSSLPHFAAQLVAAGADGLVLFNRYLEPDINLETLRVEPHLALSTREELRLPLRWIGLLRGRVKCSLAATSGVHTAEDVLKALFAGADVTMMASTLLRYGADQLGKMLAEITRWLDSRGYTSVEQMKGSVSRDNSADPSAYERGNYMKTLISFSTNIGS